jgi:hypothetical protein
VTQNELRATLVSLIQLHGIGDLSVAYDFHPEYLRMARDGEVGIGPRLARLLTAKVDGGEVAA